MVFSRGVSWLALNWTHMHDPNPADPWREYRKRRNLALMAFLGFVPIIAIAMASNAFFGTPTPAFILALPWMVFVAAAGNWFIRFKSPRCGEHFFADSRWWGYNTVVRRCLHCGLPLNSREWENENSR